MGSRVCPACGPAERDGETVCPACGAALNPAPPEAVERNRDIAEMDRALVVLLTLRRLYALFAVLLGALLGLLLLTFGGALLRSALGAAAAILLALVAALAGLGAWDVVRHPRPWSLALALAHSPLVLFAALGAIALPSLPTLILLGIHGACATTFWFGAIQSLGMAPLLRRHPDLLGARRALQGSGRPSPGSVRGRRGEKEARDSAVARRQLLGWAGGAAALVLLVAFGVHSHLHPPLEPAVESFRKEWNSGDWDAVGVRFEEGARERMAKGMRILLKRRGWDARPPELGEAVLEEKGDGGRALWLLSEGELRADWRRREGRWVLTGVRFPE